MWELRVTWTWISYSICLCFFLPFQKAKRTTLCCRCATIPSHCRRWVRPRDFPRTRLSECIAALRRNVPRASLGRTRLRISTRSSFHSEVGKITPIKHDDEPHRWRAKALASNFRRLCYAKGLNKQTGSNNSLNVCQQCLSHAIIELLKA